MLKHYVLRAQFLARRIDDRTWPELLTIAVHDEDLLLALFVSGEQLVLVLVTLRLLAGFLDGRWGAL